MLLILVIGAWGFDFELASLENFCFGEELSSQTLIVGEANVQSSIPAFTLMILNPNRELLYMKNSTANVKFSFTAIDSGTHSICFMSVAQIPIMISLDIKTGVRAKDYSNIASTKDMKEIDYRVKMYEDLIKQIHSRMQVLREREEQMRNTNQTIHSRVFTYSICTVGLLLALAAVQILYLKKFFRAKKMI